MAAVTAELPKDKAGILVDEQLGPAILRDAVEEGTLTCSPAEGVDRTNSPSNAAKMLRSVLKPFARRSPRYWFRYHPERDEALHRRQSAPPEAVVGSLHSNRCCSRFMFRTAGPAGSARSPKGDRKVYDLEVRPRLMARTIQELQDPGFEPDVWKNEGLARQAPLRTDRRQCLTRRPEPSRLHHPRPGRGR